ncbi:synaptotagmin-like protein 2 isoform X2 [Echinops telfairi]|uniref:Synaptotagmin-like protein 2 isoform X2 n=1 Tax=Echinops telfairi TaxID=9371 RepID=A0AC55DBR2_ECHTE|nr:synaptotagmin-like protein 2 isoform X2 [Echinops telfairi]
MKTTDDSISKVLDWFSRSSHSGDNKASLKHPRGIEPKGKTDVKSQTAIALVPDDTSLKEKGSKALSSTQGEHKPVGSESTSLEEGDLLLSGNYQKNDVNIEMKSLNLSQQGGTPKEGLGILQPFESYGAHQGSENMDDGQWSKSTEETLISPPTSQDSFNALSRSNTRDQVPCRSQDTDILNVDKSKLHIHEKPHSEMDFDSFAVVREPSLKANMKAERKSKGRDAHVLKASLEAENIELPPGTEKHRSPWTKAEVELQQGANELPDNHMLREKYKRVSDRISFWEGEKAAPKLTYKDPTSSRSQNQPSADPYQPMTSLGVYNTMSPGQCEDNQETMKRVSLDKGGPASHLSNFYSSNKPKETKFPKPEMSSKKEPITTFPGANNLPPGRAIPALALQHSLKGDSEMNSPLEKDRSVIGDSKPNFTVLSLKERMDEGNTEQVYDHSQFENLKKFWDLGANSNRVANVERKSAMMSPKNPWLLSSQKCKQSGDFKSPGENTREVEALLNHKKVPAGKEIEKLNSKGIPQVLPEETTFLWRPPRASIQQLPENELSKENVEKNTEWCAIPVIKKEQAYSDQAIEESIVKTSVLPREDRDAFHDSLQKLLAGASLPAIQPSHEKSHVKLELEPGFAENRTWCSKTADVEGEAKQPKEIISEHVDKTVAPPKVEHHTFMASLDKLLKESSEISLSPLQTKLKPVTTGTNTGPEESRFFKKVMEKSHNILDKREMIAPLPENEGNSGKVAVPQEVPSGECQPETERSLTMAAETTHRLLRKGSLGEEVTSPQDKPFSQDTHFVPQDRAVPSQKEISETVERVILPPKTAWNDIHAAFQELLREAQLSCSAEGEVFSGDVKPEGPEGVQAAGSTQVSQGVIVTPRATTIVPDRNNVSSFHLAADKPHIIRPYRAPPDQVTQMSPSEQNLPSSGSTADLCNKELPQKGAERRREAITQPKSQLLKVSAGLEKQMEEIIENSPSNYEDNARTVSPSTLIESAEDPRQAASAFLPKEIKETVEKSEAPSKTESAFDIGFEKLLEEIAAAPHQLQRSVEGEVPEKSPQSEKARVLSVVPHFHRTASETLGINSKSNDLKSLVNQLDKDLGTSGTINSPGDRHRESELPKKKGSFQEPGFQQTPEAICGSGNQQPIPHLMNQENSTKASKVKLFLTSSYYKRQEKEEKGFTDSEFSDGNISSNAESWRNTSSSEEEPSPVLKSMERSAPRKMPSKSLEDISSDSSNQAKVDNLPEELVRSAEDDKKADQEPDTNESVPGISTVPSQPGNPFSHPDKLKRMSKSVPAFLQDESDDRETDTASESSYQLSRHKKSPSSLTNLSSSSGMTSLSSVSGSVMSVYSGDFGNLEVKGNIQFAIDYVDSLKELHVFVAQCKDLAAADVKKQRSDPYVKTYLLPDKGKMGKKKTFVLKKTLNPVYNEILRYKIEKQILKTQKLNVSVWHRDTFKRNSFLGEVELDLETWDWDNKQNQQLKWYPLKRKTAPVALEAEDRGEMKLALQYIPEPSPGKKLPTAGEVHIWVKECLHLPMLRGSHLNSFVKCTILPDTSRKSRQKTRAVGKTTSPVFNHTMVYDGFRPEDLTEACVELTVWDHYKLTNQFLGGLRIGFGTGKSYGTEVDWMDSTSEEVALWEKMVESPNTWVEATLPLRMLLIAKISK